MSSSNYEFTFRKTLNDGQPSFLPTFMDRSSSLQPTSSSSSSSSSSPSSSFCSLWIYQAAYLLAGVFNTLGVQYLHYEGAADQTTLLPVACTYIGMSLVYFLPQKQSSKKQEMKVDHQKLFLISFTDVVAMTVLNVGLFLCGSGIYQLIYSSIVIFTALLSRIFLNKTLTLFQWVSIMVVFVGLSISALGSDQDISSESNTKFASGIVLTIIGTVIYSIIYVVNEKILSGPSAIPSHVLCYFVGMYGTILNLIYISLYTLPRWDLLVTQSIDAHAGNPSRVFVFYILVILSNFIHNHAYFHLLGTIGAVKTGIFQSLRAVLVFFLSAFFFCGFDQSQCLNSYKLISALVVIIGVSSFTFSSVKPT